MKYDDKKNDLPVNIYNCGHETLYYLLCKNNKINISLSEFYFLSEPFNFDILEDGLMMSYKTMINTISSINKNICNSFRVKKYNKNSNEEIIEELLKGNDVVLFINSKCLYYHKNSVDRCPYHMIVADRYDSKKNTLRVYDLYIQDDSNIDSGYQSFELHYLSDYIWEYAVVCGNNDHAIVIDNYDKINKVLIGMYDDKIGPFIQIKQFFSNLINSGSLLRRLSSHGKGND